MRAVSLVRTEWKIFSLGLLCLLLYNSVSLAMPMIQGSILNSVVNDSHDKFSFWVKLYLYTAIALGLLGGVQSLSFNIVGMITYNLCFIQNKFLFTVVNVYYRTETFEYCSHKVI